MHHKVSIHLVIILISILAVSSTNLGNLSFNLQGGKILQRIRRDIYEDQYEDEFENFDDEMVRKSLSSLRRSDENSEEDAPNLQSPARRNFIDDLETENYHPNRNSLSNRRIYLQPGDTQNSTIDIPKPSNADPNQLDDKERIITDFENPGGYVDPPGNGNNLIPKGVILTLLISYQLRENLLYFFGCLLQRPVDFLTEPQYTSLYTLYIELRNRPSTTNNVLKELKNVPTSNLNEQMKSIMSILGQVLPPYIGCAANFWVREIEQKRINLNSMAPNTCPSNFNILQKINIHLIKLQTTMKPMDAPTRIIEYVMGKIFVKIFYDIQRLKVVLSQGIFGIMLANFPLIPYDPVLDENIRYIFRITMKSEIPGWHDIELQSVRGDPYRFIKTIIAKILIIHNVPRSIKEALTYIMIHLRPVINHHANPDYLILQSLDDHVLILKLLLSFIVPGAYSPETLCLKDRFLGLVEEHSFHHSWMLSKTDRFRYTNSHDLLLAYLTKLQRNIPNSDSEKARTVTALLSVLIIDKKNKQFTPVSKNIEILSILGYLSNPDFPSNVNTIYNKISNILLNKPDLQSAMTKLIPKEKEKCIDVEECLKETLKNIDQMNLEIPRRMEKVIIELYDIIPIQATNPKCKTVLGTLDTRSNPPNSGNQNPDAFLTEDNGDNDIPTSDGNDNDNNNYNSNNSFNNGIGNGPNEGNEIPGITDNADGNQNPGGGTVIINNNTWITNILLPPMMSPTQEITIYINKKGAPAVDSPNIKLYPGNPRVTMPPVVVLLKPPEVNDPFGGMNLEFTTTILIKITKIIGSSDLTPILGISVPDLINTGQCPTTGALVVTLLFRALSNPLIQMDHQLLTDIKSFLSGMDLVSVITLPIVLKAAKIYPTSGIIYSIINIAEPHKSSISCTPPLNVPNGMLVFVIVDPNRLREPVDPRNPYEGLLPNVGSDTPGGQYILKLKMIFMASKISELLPNFSPEAYSSKGMLLMVLLQKLPSVPEIVAQLQLKKIIMGYVWAILIPAFYTKISYDEVLVLLGDQRQVKPDTSILIKLLPQPKNDEENKMFWALKTLLEREDLFQILLIPKPTPSTSQKELLQIIILGVLTSPEIFDVPTVTACEHYKNKIFDIKKGDFDGIVWEFEDREVYSVDAPLGQIIENVIDYSKLTNEEKNVYNNLLKYFEENQSIFNLSQDFPIKDYKTEGTFIKGLFQYLIQKPIISQRAKKYIQTLSPHVMLKGPGAKPLQISNQGNPSSARRTLSKFEINV